MPAPAPDPSVTDEKGSAFAPPFPSREPAPITGHVRSRACVYAREPAFPYIAYDEREERRAAWRRLCRVREHALSAPHAEMRWLAWERLPAARPLAALAALRFPATGRARPPLPGPKRCPCGAPREGRACVVEIRFQAIGDPYAKEDARVGQHDADEEHDADGKDGGDGKGGEDDKDGGDAGGDAGEDAGEDAGGDAGSDGSSDGGETVCERASDKDGAAGAGAEAGAEWITIQRWLVAITHRKLKQHEADLTAYAAWLRVERPANIPRLAPGAADEVARRAARAGYLACECPSASLRAELQAALT